MVHYFDEQEREYDLEPNDEFADDVDPTDGNALEKIKDLKEKLKACEKERKEYLDGWQRSKADYLNSKKRYDEERMEIMLRAEENFIMKLLPLCDSFDMAALHGAEGMEQIHGQFKNFLASMGVTEIEALGKPFDPHVHEALKTEPVNEEAMVDTVVAVLQKGYMRKDRLLRPAKVVIGAAQN